MEKQFNPMRVVRLSSPEVVAELVAATGGDREAYLTDPTAWFDRLDGKARRDMLTRLRAVHDIAGEGGHGLAVAAEEADAMGVTLNFAEGETIHDKAIHLLLRHPALADKELHLLHAEQLKHGRSWHTRQGMPEGRPDLSEEAQTELKLAVGGYYFSREGRGDHQHIERITSSDGTHYYFLYLADYPQRTEDFDDAGNMTPRDTRGGFEVVFAYCDKTKTLHTSAHGNAKCIDALQEIFASAILHGHPRPKDPRKEPYRLNGLLRRDFPFPVQPEDGVRLILVQAVNVKIIGGTEESKRRMAFSTTERENREAMYDMLDRYLNRHNLPLSCLHVIKAQIVILFNERGPVRTMTIELTPKACNLKNKPEEQRLLGERLLRRWNIETVD